MTNEEDVKLSPLSKKVTRDGASVDVEIYEDGAGGWLLEIIDEHNNSTVWDDIFASDREALKEAMDAIEQEGIDAFIG